jgi:hypothetical protein
MVSSEFIATVYIRFRVISGSEGDQPPCMSRGVLDVRNLCISTAKSLMRNAINHDVQIQTITARLNFRFYRDECRAKPRPLK